MTVVQTLRAQAYAAGNLKSGSQITVVQKDLGPSTSQIASAMTGFNPDQSWTIAQ